MAFILGICCRGRGRIHTAYIMVNNNSHSEIFFTISLPEMAPKAMVKNRKQPTKNQESQRKKPPTVAAWPHESSEFPRGCHAWKKILATAMVDQSFCLQLWSQISRSRPWFFGNPVFAALCSHRPSSNSTERPEPVNCNPGGNHFGEVNICQWFGIDSWFGGNALPGSVRFNDILELVSKG